MKYQALATDYDGTLATDGRVDQPAVDALGRLRDAGVRLILVTGRELGDLFNTFTHPTIFDRIVAENGAVLYNPALQSIEVLGAGPPPDLLSTLTELNIPISVGHSIIATVEPYEHQLLSAIRQLGLEWHLIFNKGSVMALPADITKATGLTAAARALGVSLEMTVGVGDAENDQAFLRACGLAVAVQNALPSVKEIAHIVTGASSGSGVIELADRLLHDEQLTRGILHD